MTRDQKPTLSPRRRLPKDSEVFELNCKFRQALDPSLQERTRSSYEYVLQRCSSSTDPEYSSYAFWLLRLLGWIGRHPEELRDLCLPGEKPGQPAKETAANPVEHMALNYRLNQASSEDARRERIRQAPLDSSFGCNGIFDGLPGI